MIKNALFEKSRYEKVIIDFDCDDDWSFDICQ